jgi:hypothetical protein
MAAQQQQQMAQAQAQQAAQQVSISYDWIGPVEGV